MRALSVEIFDSAPPIITVETGFWIFKRISKFQSAGRLVADYHKWVKLPNRTIVGDGLSFQLDSWLADAKRVAK